MRRIAKLGGEWRSGALLFLTTMSFSYNYGANPIPDYIRLMISDTVEFDAQGQRVYAFEDQEIQAFVNIEMAVWQSSQFFSPPTGASTLPTVPIPYRRIAATALESLASNQARLQIIVKLLDVTLNPNASREMRAQAQALRDADDNSGALVIIEQVNDVFSFRDRYWKQVQRMTGGGFVG